MVAAKVPNSLYAKEESDKKEVWETKGHTRPEFKLNNLK